MNLKLNAISKAAFDAAGAGEDISVVALDGTKVSRRDLISACRLCATEYTGMNLNERPDVKGAFHSRLNGKGANYSDFSRSVADKMLLFCAAMSNRANGRPAPKSISEVKQNANYARDPIFLRTLAAITSDTLEPIYATIMSDVAMGGLMQWESIPFGGTKEIDIKSNDYFRFEDSAWGSARSASYNALYAKTVTLNPKPYTTQAKIKWYQDIVNGDAGRYFSAIMYGMWNKIYAIFIQRLIAATSNTSLVPAALTVSTYTTGNWNNLTTKVAAVNGVTRSDLLAFGEIGALSAVVPTDGTGGAMLGMQYGLGERWFREGFLPNAAGVSLLEIMPAVVPGTQNSTIDTIGLGNNIIVTAKGGYGYAPIFAGYYEGSPMVLDLTPDETGDLTIDLTATAMFDIKAVVASKIGVMTNVTA